VTRSEWLHIAAPLVAVMGCLMASIAYGLAARKAWSRHLAIAIFVLIIAYASALGALNVLRAHHHVARHRERFPLRLCRYVVLLFETKCCCVFS